MNLNLEGGVEEKPKPEKKDLEPNVVLYFHMHQPYRITNPVSKTGNIQENLNLALESSLEEAFAKIFTGPNPAKGGGDASNRAIFEKVACSSYLPITDFWYQSLLNNPNLKINLSISGTLLDQCQEFGQNQGIGYEVLAKLKKLVNLPNVELLAESYYHGLSFFYNPSRHIQQIAKHIKTVQNLFGITPTNFRNTELIYSNQLGWLAGQLGFGATICDVYEDILDHELNKSGDYCKKWMQIAGQEIAGIGQTIHTFQSQTKIGKNLETNLEIKPESKTGSKTESKTANILLKDEFLSRTVFFVNSDKMVEQSLAYIQERVGMGQQFFGIYNDFEVVGEHNPASGFTYQNLQNWVDSLLENSVEFALLQDLVKNQKPEGSYDLGNSLENNLENQPSNLDLIESASGSVFSSWANQPKNLISWRGNMWQELGMLELAELDDLYQNYLDQSVDGEENYANKQIISKTITEFYSRLTTSDNFYYMADLAGQDGVQHRMFSPYNSPEQAYQAYIGAVNILREWLQFDAE